MLRTRVSPGRVLRQVQPSPSRRPGQLWISMRKTPLGAATGFVDAVGRGMVLFEEAASLRLPEPSITVVETWTTIELGLEGRP